MQAMCLEIFLDKSKISKKRIIRYASYVLLIIMFIVLTNQQAAMGTLLFGTCFANFIYDGRTFQTIWINFLGLAVIYIMGTIDWMLVDGIVKAYGKEWIGSQIFTEIGRASCRERVGSTCRSRWSPSP